MDIFFVDDRGGLIALSYIIAIFASYIVLEIVDHVRAETNPKIKYSWLMGGAFVIGVGMWSMHFIGMLAMAHHIDIHYLPGVCVLSMAIAIVAAEAKKRGAVVVAQNRHATHDTLTNLPNRTLLLDRLAQSVNQAKRINGKMAVFFIDIDQFKLVNDSMGHAAGDDLLRGVAIRLQSCLRKTDTLARMGGDEFVVVLNEFKREEELGFVAQRILIALAQSFHIADEKCDVSASIGISVYPRDGEDADALLKNADTAMYQVKASGRNNFKFYSRGMKIKRKNPVVLSSTLP